MRPTLRVLGLFALAVTTPALALAAEPGSDEGAGEHDPGELAKATQNPVADMISVPFQNNTSYNVGPTSAPRIRSTSSRSSPSTSASTC